MMRALTAMIVAGAAAAMGGCATAEVSDAGGFPRPLRIEMRSATTDGKQVYYRLEDDGTLYFGGGRFAQGATAEQAGKVDDERRIELWRITRRNDLLDGDGSMFAQEERVEYDVTLRAGSRSASYRAIDGQVPGLAELEAALFRIQADHRYRGLFRSIDERIEKSGGAVPKR